MARNYPDDASAMQYGHYSTSEEIQATVSGAHTISVAALIRPEVVTTVRHQFLRTHNATGANMVLRLATDGEVQVGFRSTTGDTFEQTKTTTQCSADTWHWVGCVADFNSGSKRLEPYLDGVGEGSIVPTTGWSSGTFITGSITSQYDAIGGISRVSGTGDPQPLVGRLAYLVIWKDIDLETIGGYAALSNGIHPYLIAPDKIVFAPDFDGRGDGEGLICRFSGVSLTEDTNNTYAQVESHPSALGWPSNVIYTPAAAGAVPPPPMINGLGAQLIDGGMIRAQAN